MNPRLLIALHSPSVLCETGLRVGPPENRRDSDPILSRAVRSLQSGLQKKYCKKWASFAYFEGRGGAVSVHFRLAGGAPSLALTLLRPNSLVTGKNTGNFQYFALENALIFL